MAIDNFIQNFLTIALIVFTVRHYRHKWRSMRLNQMNREIELNRHFDLGMAQLRRDDQMFHVELKARIMVRVGELAKEVPELQDDPEQFYKTVCLNTDGSGIDLSSGGSLMFKIFNAKSVAELLDALPYDDAFTREIRVDVVTRRETLAERHYKLLQECRALGLNVLMFQYVTFKA